jgi:hypothetical protein
MPYEFSMAWMFLADPADLRERFVQTLIYFHVYPPGMNILSGLLLAVSPHHPEVVAHLAFVVCGVVIVSSLFDIGQAVGLGRWSAGCLVLCFSLIPQTLYFENLYLYTYVVAATLCFCCVCLHRAVLHSSAWAWFGFFLACAWLGYVRSTFHLAWFVAMIGLCAWFGRGGDLKKVALAAALPAALLLALYLKNQIIFDAFGATSAAGGNLTHVTISRMPEEERRAWVREGKLSPFANISVYASPRAYRSYFDSSASKRWPQISAFEKPTIKAPNYNHWFFLEVNQRRRQDAMVYLRERPGDYARTVLAGLVQIFEPSTRWHPKHGTKRSPHRGHDRVIGGWESLYTKIVYGFPSPVGIYVFVPLPIAWACWRVWKSRESRSTRVRARAAVLAFCVVQIGFVVVVSSLFTIGESARYRYQIEALIWIISAGALSELLTSFRARIRSLKVGSSGRPTPP